MGALPSTIALSKRDNLEREALRSAHRPNASGQMTGGILQFSDGPFLDPASGRTPFLRIPPFPGSRVSRFGEWSSIRPFDGGEAAEIVELARTLRVGGTFWAAQPELPSNYALARSPEAAQAAKANGDLRVILWTSEPASDAGDARPIRGECDPWHMLSGASALFTEDDDDVVIVAALLGIPTYGRDGKGSAFEKKVCSIDQLARRMFGGLGFSNPFTGEQMGPREAVRLCGFWRSLIDANRDISGALGFAFWKRDNIAPLLWNGSSPVVFGHVPDSASPGRSVAIWRSKVSDTALAALEARGTPLIEVEDGFLRSQGLGADCVPPLSITVDSLGAYFDPSRPSELENILQHGEMGGQLLKRAKTLRKAVVKAGLGKYEIGAQELSRPAGPRLHILVPGQVEDDRAVLAGGCGLTSNLDLLRRVRERAPDAYILYKPHPDVIAGHRRGSVPDNTCLKFADVVVIDLPISSLIEMVDEVHVNTSLAGFEALMRGKSVTTYGVPFYAGWGLTRDFGPVPARRTTKRTLDEVVAAALLLYPRYIDPVTGLPCPAEVVVDRLAKSAATQQGLVVSMRRLQGKVMRGLRALAR